MRRALGNSPACDSIPGLAREHEDRKWGENLMLGQQQRGDSTTKGKCHIILNFNMFVRFSKEQNVVEGRERCTLH